MLNKEYMLIDRNQSLDKMERQIVESILTKNHGNRTYTARSLVISVRTLQRKLKKWGYSAAIPGRKAM